MPKRPLSLALLSLLVLISAVNATEEHLLNVYQPLATSPEIEIGMVSYVTWFGALEESTIAAVTWPALLDSPHKERSRLDLNLASILGVAVVLDQRGNEQWQVKLDLTQLRAIPDIYQESHLAEDVGRPEILNGILKATTMNLKRVGVFDCALNVLGEDAHDDLKEMKFPKLLNPIDKVWGPWEFKHLPKQFADGNLHRLAAQSLSDTHTLDTIFLIASGEQWTADSRSEMTTLLRQLMARHGDDTFATQLGHAEAEVQQRILSMLRTEPKTRSNSSPLDWQALFPRTLNIRQE